MRTYENGYLDKIAYHIHKENYDRARSFKASHEERYGELTDGDYKFIHYAVKNLDRAAFPNRIYS